MSPPPVRLDFVPRRSHWSPLGALLLGLGVASAAGVYLEYRALGAQRAGLELKLAAATRRADQGPAIARAEAHLLEESGAVAAQLATPWTGLLAELEQAAHDSEDAVAVLSIEPDQDKRRVHVRGESRDLALALAYVQRLQSSRALKYPMLDSHEVRTDDSEHPVRFELSADWVDLP